MQRLLVGLFFFGVLACLGLHGAALQAGPPTAALYVDDAWLAAGSAVFMAALVAAFRLEAGRVRIAWSFWAGAVGVWLAGSVLRAVGTATGGDLEPAADALWLLFAVLGLIGLSYRVPPGLLSFRLSLFDAIPLVLALTAAVVISSRGTASATVGEAFVAGVYPMVFGLLAFVGIQMALINRTTNMLLVSTGLVLVAAGAVLWPSFAFVGDPAAGDVAVLWSLGLLLFGLAALRRALSPGWCRQFPVPIEDTGWRALPPTTGLILLVALMLVSGREHQTLIQLFAIAAVVELAARFYIARHASGRLVRELRSSRLALEESERRFRAVFASAPLGLSMVDSTGQFVACNSAFSDMLGREEAELLRMTFADITHPEDVGRNVELWNELLEARIPREEHDRLFERFFRASSATDRQIQGTGLGLVEAHSGSISFESAVGSGTTFRVELPIQPDVSRDRPTLPSPL